MLVTHSGDETVYRKSSWQYFDSLNFLKDQFTARKSSGNLPAVEHDAILDENTNNFQLYESSNEHFEGMKHSPQTFHHQLRN